MKEEFADINVEEMLVGLGLKQIKCGLSDINAGEKRVDRLRGGYRTY